MYYAVTMTAERRNETQTSVETLGFSVIAQMGLIIRLHLSQLIRKLAKTVCGISSENTGTGTWARNFESR